MSYSSVIAGKNGTHVERLILGVPSNPEKLIDDPENKTEIKSCRKRHTCMTKRGGSITTRFGRFKLNVEQHKHLLEIDGFYLFCVLDSDEGAIVLQKKVRAMEIEDKHNILTRTVTKHHQITLNWHKVFD